MLLDLLNYLGACSETSLCAAVVDADDDRVEVAKPLKPTNVPLNSSLFFRLGEQLSDHLVLRIKFPGAF